MTLPWHKGVFSRITQVAPHTRLFFIRLGEMATFDFRPGQFVTLDLPIADKPARRWRSYSIASAPNGTNEIELVIVWLKGGLGTTYLFNEIKVGDEVTLRGPLGVFTLPETLEEPVYFICTGTGIAPFRSMLHHMRRTGAQHQHPVYLIVGTRRQEDLLYHQDMLALEKQLPYFHYLPTLSREKWSGATGYVHPLYEQLAAGSERGQFYLCGWKDMIKEAKERIQALGYDRKCIHQELYG